MARPTKYKEEYCKIVAAMAKLGAIDVEMAQELGVSIQTFNNWKVKFPEFMESLRLEKEKADSRVEDALFKRAVGYTYEEEDVRVIKGKVVRTKVQKHIPPDHNAASFWLKNRKKADWRDRHEFEHSGGISVVQVNELDEKL